MSKRVGVLTFHRCINYGSYWQARCIVEALRERGHDAVLLNHQSRRINLREWRCALQPIPGDDHAHRKAYRAKTSKFFTAFGQLPLSTPFPLDAPQNGEAYDVVLVGSDEVWNLRHPWYGGKPIFYGDGLRAGRLASYAASFGNQGAAGGLEPQWAERLLPFDAISVRDRNSQALVESATGRRPTLVLDPCLAFAHLIPKVGQQFVRPYAVIYGHGLPDWLIGAVARWAQHGHVRLVSVGYYNDWADEQRIDAGPLEFSALVEGATAVITNFFHGCVFALLNGKPFVTAPSDYRFNKVRDLMTALGADRHLVSETTTGSEYSDILAGPLAVRVTNRIAILRQASEGYLNAIGL